MNARAKRSYVGVYQGKETLLTDTIMTNAEVMDYLANHPDFVPCGDVGYLSIEAPRPDIVGNLHDCIDDAHLCREPLGARPVYLKDDYENIRHKVAIRPMKEEDLPIVLDLENECFKHPYTEKELRYELAENEFAKLYVATRKKEVVGFIDFSITFNSATLNQIGVRKAFRGQGIGGLLLDQALKDCSSSSEPVEFFTLEVRASNETAQRFYARRGFENICVKKALL